MLIPEKFLGQLSTRTRNLLTRQNILTREILLNLKEKELLELPNVGLKTIKEILFLQKSMTSISNKEEKHILQPWHVIKENAVLDRTAYAEFSNLVDTCLQHFIPRERSREVLKRRFGLFDGKRWTLDNAGEFGVLTRQRVNQLEKVFFEKWVRPENVAWKNQLLVLFFDSIYNLLAEQGGIIEIDILTNHLTEKWGWSVTPTPESIANFLEMSSDFKVCRMPQLCLFIPEFRCFKCSATTKCLKKLVQEPATVFVELEKTLTSVVTACRQNKSCQVQPRPNLTKNYACFLGMQTPEIVIDQDKLFSKNTWIIRTSKSRLEVIETVLLEASGPVHFKTLATEINRRRTDKFSERNVHATISRLKEAVHWDRGTFIHHSLVAIPYDLIAKIEEHMVELLRQDSIPYISISGVFSLYEEKLSAANVPTESAFFSCLRKSANPLLFFPEYPYVMLADSDRNRRAVPLELETFVLEQEGIVDTRQMRNYAVEKLHIKEALFLLHFVKIPNLLCVQRSKYIHIDNIQQIGLTIDDRVMNLILTTLNELSSSFEHVSVVKLFNMQKANCLSNGIISSRLLFSILQYLYPDAMRFSRYPRIRFPESGRHISGVTMEAITYIKEKNSPCTMDELSSHFVDKLEYNQQSVHNVVLSDEILRFDRSQVVHIKNIDWTDEKQNVLNSIVNAHLSSRNEVGLPFGLTSHIVEHFHALLPSLANNIQWTARLLLSLLLRTNDYIVIGMQKNAFLPQNNTFNIQNISSLLFFMLDKFYDGKADLETFIVDMREAGILQKNLTKTMLGTDGRLDVKNNTIYIRR